MKWPHTALIKSKCKNSRQKLKEKCGDKELWLEEEEDDEEEGTGQQGMAGRGLRTVAHPTAVYRQNTRVNILTISGHCARGRALIAMANLPPLSLSLSWPRAAAAVRQVNRVSL